MASLREKRDSVRDETVKAIDDIRKGVDLVTHEFEVASYRCVLFIFFHPSLFIFPFLYSSCCLLFFLSFNLLVGQSHEARDTNQHPDQRFGGGYCP